MSAWAEPRAALTGPFRFILRRLVDATGISGTGQIADGVEFDDGTCILRWNTAHRSTGVYACHADMMQIHGHNGQTVCEWIDAPPTEAFKHGSRNCLQDGFENCAFASIGGLDARANPRAPKYVAEADVAEWLRGYLTHARAAYGEDWATCSFGWGPAITIGGNDGADRRAKGGGA